MEEKRGKKAQHPEGFEHMTSRLRDYATTTASINELPYVFSRERTENEQPGGGGSLKKDGARGSRIVLNGSRSRRRSQE